MEKITLEKIARYAEGQVYGRADLTIAGVQIDSRHVGKEDLFVALTGENVDGHAFVFAALDTCDAALVAREWAEANSPKLPAGKGLVVVEETLSALQNLAHRYRQRFHIPIIGVTGSSGKTTTKDMIASVLGAKFSVHKTKANFNNELGLPLSLLGIEPDHQAAVVEMGMRGLGEIGFLAELAEPTIGVITNVGETHLELLGSQANIASAKGELLRALPSDGIAILNGDDVWCRTLASELECSVLYYGLNDGVLDLVARSVTPMGEHGTRFTAVWLGQTEVEVLLPLPGRHNVANALAAMCVGLSLGMDLAACAKGLEEIQLTGMRLEICAGPWQSTIINDTYNANPDSTKASLQVLAESGLTSPKIAVLGSMLELGSATEPGHRQVGEFAATVPDLAYLITVGEFARFIALGAEQAGLPSDKIHAFMDTQQAVSWLENHPIQDAWILVKGSRGMEMERIVQALSAI